MRATRWMVALLLGGAGRVWAGVPDDCVAPLGPEYEVNSVGDQDCDFTGTDGDNCPITLRCAITLANAAGGPAAIAFNIDDAACGGGVCVIVVENGPLPALRNDDLTIDGSTQSARAGTTNPAVFPGFSVGVGPAVAVGAFEAPEIEIRAAETSLGAPLTVGLDVQATGVVIRNLAVWGFGDASGTALDVGANVRLSPGAAPEPIPSMTVEDNVIGAAADDFAPQATPGPPSTNVDIRAGQGANIRHNLIGFSTFGIVVTDSLQVVVQGNSIEGHSGYGVALQGATTQVVNVLENRILGNGFAGIDSGPIAASGGQHVLRSNTLIGNGLESGPFGPALVPSSPGIQLRDGGIDRVERNLITANVGAGVQVTEGSENNIITRNSIADNGGLSGQIGIDLHVFGVDPVEDQALGTAPFVTTNDSNGDRTDFPTLTGPGTLVNVIERAGQPTQLRLVGSAPSGARVELFLADGATNGEGETFIDEFNAPAGVIEQLLTLADDEIVVQGTVLVATATVTNDTSEFTPNLVVTSFADLAVTIADAPDPVGVSDTLTYTIAVSNAAGGSDAPAISVQVALDDDLTGGALVGPPDGWSCVAAATGNDLSCTRAALASGASSSFTVSAAAPATVQPLSTTVTVDSPNVSDAPGDEADNSDTETTVMTAQDNLRTSIVADSNPVNVDDPVHYLVKVTNPALAGTTARATGVALTVALPAGTTGFASTVPTGWSCLPNAALGASTSVICTTAQVLVGSTHDIVITSVAPHLAGNHDVDVTTQSAETDPFVATVVLMVGAVNDLVLRITDVPDPAATGVAVTYTLTVVHRGPDPSTGAILVATLPATGTFASATPGMCTFSAPAGTVTCVVPDLENGEPHQFVVTVFASDTPSIMRLLGVVTPGPLDVDTNLGDNTVESFTTVSDKADLALSLTTPSQATTSASFRALITIANLGVKDAIEVVATYELPGGAIFISAAGTGWACGNSDTTVTCTRPRMDSLQSSVITVTALAPPTAGQVSVSALVESTVAEESAANNSDIATIDVVSPLGTADLALTLADAPDPVDLGGTITYTLSAANGGPDPAGSVTVTLQLPAAATFVGAAGLGWACSQTSALVTCTRPSLAAAGPSTITVTATAPDQPGTLNAGATISSTAEDPSSANNVASASTVVVGTADVAADLTGPATARGGTTIAYTATVSNAGPRTATGVQAVITVGAGATLGTVLAADLSCTSAGLVVTCTGDSLAVGSTTVTVNAAAPGVAGPLTTTLAVTTSANDPVPANNTDSVTTTVTDPDACTIDADCGDAGSGRVCNENGCVDGCRGMGGNGCPQDQMCTSATSDIGSCEAVDPPDAGTIDAGAAEADAGVPDAPVTGTPDASTDGSLEGSGCSCTTGRERFPPFGGLLLVAVALLALRRPRP